MSVDQICQRDVDTADPSETVFQAAERMHQRTVGALVVVDESNTPIGIVTDRDLVIRVMAANRDPLITHVRDVMTAWPKTVTGTTPIEWAVSLMRSGGFRRVPVVDEANRLVGILALDDVLMLISEELANIGQLIAGETPQAAATPDERR